MKKQITMIVAIAATCAVFAAGSTKTQDFKNLSEEDKQALFEKRTGGLVRHEAEGPKIVVVDGRKMPGKVLKYFEQENIEAHGTRPGLPVKTYAEPIESDAITAALATLDKEKGAMAIIIYNGGAKAPGVTACPEDRVGAINADRYYNKEFLLLKEVWRIIGFIGGVGYSQYSSDPMQLVFSTEDLQEVEGTALLPMSLNALKKFNTKFGIKPAYSMPYIAACRQGWAPQPTNDIQRAIWDKVHQIPDKPITIEYDPKIDK